MNYTRKLIMMLALVLCLGLAACQEKPAPGSGAASQSDSGAVSQSEAQPPSSSSQQSLAPADPWFGQSDPTLDFWATMTWNHLEARNWPDTSRFVPHILRSEDWPEGNIAYLAPESLSTGYGGAGVINWDGGFADPEGLKVGEFQVFGLLEDWGIEYGGEEPYRLEVGTIVDGAEVHYPLTDPRAQPCAENLAGCVKETAKYQRVITNDFIHMVSYMVDIGHGYGVTVYFYISPELTSAELERYDFMIDSMTLIPD